VRKRQKEKKRGERKEAGKTYRWHTIAKESIVIAKYISRKFRDNFYGKKTVHSLMKTD